MFPFPILPASGTQGLERLYFGMCKGPVQPVVRPGPGTGAKQRMNRKTRPFTMGGITIEIIWLDPDFVNGLPEIPPKKLCIFYIFPLYKWR